MNESYGYLFRFLFAFIGILALIFIMAVLTPKLAAAADRILAKVFRKNSVHDDGLYKVKSIYDSPSINEETEKADDDKNKLDGDVKNG